jgi:hypothetical protein
MKKIEYHTCCVRSCFNRVIELIQKMLIFKRIVTKSAEGLITCLPTVESEAPASSKTFVTSLWPFDAARCRGVSP